MGSLKPKQREQNVVNTEAMRDLTIPLPGGRIAILRSPARMSDADHGILTKYLEVMKDALITTTTETSADDGSSDE